MVYYALFLAFGVLSIVEQSAYYSHFDLTKSILFSWHLTLIQSLLKFFFFGFY
jgi:hypothetical protein